MKEFSQYLCEEKWCYHKNYVISLSKTQTYTHTHLAKNWWNPPPFEKLQQLQVSNKTITAANMASEVTKSDHWFL